MINEMINVFFGHFSVHKEYINTFSSIKVDLFNWPSALKHSAKNDKSRKENHFCLMRMKLGGLVDLHTNKPKFGGDKKRAHTRTNE